MILLSSALYPSLLLESIPFGMQHKAGRLQFERRFMYKIFFVRGRDFLFPVGTRVTIILEILVSVFRL